MMLHMKGIPSPQETAESLLPKFLRPSTLCQQSTFKFYVTRATRFEWSMCNVIPRNLFRNIAGTGTEYTCCP
jgi:hypothetical protein